MMFTSYFYPGFLAGGPIQSTYNLSLFLLEEFDVYVVCLNHDYGTHPYEGVVSNEWSVVNKINVLYLSDDNVSFSAFKRIISFVKPNFLYFNSLFDLKFTLLPLVASYMLKWTPKTRILNPRGELNKGALLIKPTKKKLFIFMLRLFHVNRFFIWNATTEIEKEAIIKQFGRKSNVRVFSNLPRQIQPVLHKKSWRRKTKFLFLSRISEIKNLDFLLDVLLEVEEEIELSIYGGVCDEAYWQICKDKIALAPRHIKISYYGSLHPDKLEAVFLKHDFFILPTKGENFGHAIFEALLYGLPVIISDNTPWRHLEKDGIGIDISLSRSKVWVDTIEKYSKMPFEKYETMSLAAWCFAKDYKSNPALKSQALKLFTCRDAK